jgi:hypothetical protein
MAFFFELSAVPVRMSSFRFHFGGENLTCAPAQYDLGGSLNRDNRARGRVVGAVQAFHRSSRQIFGASEKTTSERALRVYFEKKGAVNIKLLKSRGRLVH